MQDLTGEAPVRRMSVARGSLAPVAPGAKIDLGSCEAAAKLAVKQADRLLPDAHPFQVGHVDFLFGQTETGLDVTVTVQGHARASLDSHALTGVALALLAARQQLGPDVRLVDLQLVQNVE